LRQTLSNHVFPGQKIKFKKRDWLKILKLEAWDKGISPIDFDKIPVKELQEIQELRDIKSKHSENVAEMQKNFREMSNFG